MDIKSLIKTAYTAFNERDIEMALSTMRNNVRWCNGWEGGILNGHNEIKLLWTKQWTEINPKLEPIGYDERANGSVEVRVYQNIKDLDGNLMFDGLVKHIYTFQKGLIQTMETEPIE